MTLRPASPLSRRTVLAGAGGLAASGAVTGCAPTAGPTPGPAGPGPAPRPGSSPDPGTARRTRGRPIVVGHRGASGYRPEHTLAAYELAVRMGADAVDVDLAPTRDGALVARHEPEIGATTDVAAHPRFAGRRATKVIDGTSYDGWFTEDLTLAELRSLRATERIPETRPHNTLYDGRFPIPTLDEVLDLLDGLAGELRRPVGVLPEVKHPTYFRGIGLPVEPALVEVLRRRGRDRADSGVVVQSFEVASLETLAGRLGCPLLQLVDAAGTAPADFVATGDPRTYDDLLTPDGLREVATYAARLGPAKGRVVPDDGPPSTLVADAHTANLRVMPYTFRNENEFLPASLRRPAPGGTTAQAPPDTYGDAFAEYARFAGLGVDGLFSDNPDTAREALRG